MLTIYRKHTLIINLILLKMKKMNMLALFISLLITFSCDESTHFLNEDSSVTNKSNEQTYLYEIDILYVGTVTRINELKEQKQAFASKAAEKGRNVLKQLEKTQKEIERLIVFKEYLLGLPKPKGPGPSPIPMPPAGCLVDSNCDPNKNLQNVRGIVLNKEFETHSVLLRDAKNNIIAKGGRISKDHHGQPYIQLETNLKGAGHLEIIIATKEFGEISTKIPVYKK